MNALGIDIRTKPLLGIDTPALADIRPWKSPVWRKLAMAMGVVAGVGTVSIGAIESYLSVQAARNQIGALQLAHARDGAFAIETALQSIGKHVGAVSVLPWHLQDQFTMATRREEFGRLLRLIPALETISLETQEGQTVLSVSRRHIDATAPTTGALRYRVLQDRVLYRDDYEPVFTARFSYGEPHFGGYTLAAVSLRRLALDVEQPLTVAGGAAYAVDGSGTVVLSRDINAMLRRLQVRQPLAAQGEVARPVVGLGGGEVLRSSMPIKGTDWKLLVEQPTEPLMHAVWMTLARNLALAALCVVASLWVAFVFVGRISRPVHTLHAAVLRMSSGRLDTRVALNTHDELEDLANQFNRMAASLQANVTDLEDKVEAKTKDLQRASRHKSEFLANMSHELRTPLNAILGFADVLREGMAGPMSDEQREYVTDIHASGLHLLALINDVLDLSRIEAGQLELEIAAFDVPETVAAAVALVRQRAVQKGLLLKLDLAPELGLWSADARRFKQVVLNLLGNAVKFTPEGGAVNLRAGVSAEEGLWMEVQDSGGGIAAADHEAVFEEFRQVGANAAGRAEGSGLGLALVRRLVRQHGGEVTLQSALGAGATFRFNIPAFDVSTPSASTSPLVNADDSAAARVAAARPQEGTL